MIGPSRAAELITQKYPKLTVTSGADYDRRYYLFVAVEKPGEPDFNAPYYAVDKRTGTVSSFCPTADLDGFFDAFEKRSIKIGGDKNAIRI